MHKNKEGYVVVKKKFDENNPPIIEQTSALPAVQEHELDNNLLHVIEMLDESDAQDVRVELLASILDIAKEIAQRDWERASEVVQRNVTKLDCALPDDLIMDMIDIAIHDPQVEKLTKAMGVMGGYNFEKLADVPEVKALVPDEGALALIELAHGYAEEGAKILNEVQILRSAIDPSYTLPDEAKLDLH